MFGTGGTKLIHGHGHWAQGQWELCLSGSPHLFLDLPHRSRGIIGCAAAFTSYPEAVLPSGEPIQEAKDLRPLRACDGA